MADTKTWRDLSITAVCLLVCIIMCPLVLYYRTNFPWSSRACCVYTSHMNIVMSSVLWRDSTRMHVLWVMSNWTYPVVNEATMRAQWTDLC